MWVIVVNRSINLHRDNRISELIGEYSTQEYLSKLGKRYSSTSNTIFSLCFKTESGAKRIVEKFKSDSQKEFYINKFNWIKDCVLSIRKMTKEEWESKINFELSTLDNKYKRQRNKLISKMDQYK